MLKKVSFFFALLILIPLSVSGAGLGKIKVNSGLGEPLDAEIELLENASEEAASLNARVGSAEEYTASGLPDAYIAQGIKIQVIRHADNSRILRLSSERPINEPFIELLVKAESTTTNILRQYTLLLDPPTSRFGDSETDKQTPSEAKKKLKPNVSSADNNVDAASDVLPEYIPRKSSKAAKKKVVAEPATANYTPPVANSGNVSSDSYVTQAGDVFGKVAQRYQPEGVSLKRVMAAFFAANPDAFVNGDMNLLKAGQTLRIPNQDAMKNGMQSNAKEPAKPTALPAVVKEEETAAKPAAPPKFVLKISPGDADSEPAERANGDQTTDQSQATSTQAASTQATSTNDPANPEIAPEPNAATNPGQDNLTTAETAQPKAAPAQLQNPLAVETSVEDKSLIDGFITNLPWIAFGMAIPLACILLIYFFNRRRMTAMQNIEESMVAYSSHNQFDESASSGLVQYGLGETRTAYTPATDDFDATSPGTVALYSRHVESPKETEMDIHEVDPLVEAEIYMSYGRDEHAENILVNALAKHPHKHELSLGLLKIYAERKDTEAFERVARQVYEAAETGSLDDVVIWGKVVILGLSIDPSNDLYLIEGVSQAGKDKAATQEIPAKLEQQPLPNYDAMHADLELPPLTEMEPVSAAQEFMNMPGLELPIDLPIDEPETIKPIEKNNILEFNLDEFKPMAENESDQRLDTDKLFALPKKKK